MLDAEDINHELGEELKDYATADSSTLLKKGWKERPGSCFRDEPLKIIAMNQDEQNNMYYLITWKPNVKKKEILSPSWVNDWIVKSQYPMEIAKYIESLYQQSL